MAYEITIPKIRKLGLTTTETRIKLEEKTIDIPLQQEIPYAEALHL